MKAFQLLQHGTPGTFAVREVPEPQPGPDEVVVRVHACGVNHLDLWLEAAVLPLTIELPRTPGGEIAGVVESVGVGVADWTPGDRVAVQSNLFCGECEFCRRGDESLCLHGELLGVTREGGFAERVAVPTRALVRLPEGVDLETSAALTLAGSTAMHMLTDRCTVKAGDWVLVVGASSGVGSAAIQIANGFGARVITTGSTEAKRRLGEALGAEAVVDSTKHDWSAQVRQITQKRGVDVVIEHVGGDILRQCMGCLARGGTVVTCGATAGRQVGLDLWPFFVKQQRLVGSYGRTRANILATLKWAAERRLRPVVDRVFPLEATEAAFARLRSREALGKVLVRCGPV
jgi:NADPH:quinone reductase-like Zn-dependent oxidoreductase